MSLTQIADEHPEFKEVLDDSTVSNVEACRRLASMGLQTSEASVRRYREKTNWTRAVPTAGPPADSSETTDSALAEQVEMLRADNSRMFRQLTKLKARGDEYIEAVYRAARDAARNSPVHTVVPPKPSKSSGDPEGALIHTTDWQGGKKTDSYDFGIMEERIKRFTDKVHRLVEIQRKDHPVDEGLLLVTGDMVEGVSIFPGQVWELDGALYEQMFRVSRLLQWQIEQLASMFTEFDVVLEWGNHGRLGKKGDGIKPSDNVDRMVYGIVEEQVRKTVPNLRKYQFSGDWYQHFTFGNYKAVAIHGDEIKSFGGNVPAYGILRKSNAWASGVLPQFKDLYLGHYHQTMVLQLANGGRVFMTGSPESDNVYAREFVASQSEPTQRLNFIDLDKGRVTAEYVVYVED